MPFMIVLVVAKLRLILKSL